MSDTFMNIVSSSAFEPLLACRWIHISMWFLAAMGILWVLAIVTFYWPVTMDPDYERGDRLVTEHITDVRSVSIQFLYELSVLLHS